MLNIGSVQFTLTLNRKVSVKPSNELTLDFLLGTRRYFFCFNTDPDPEPRVCGGRSQSQNSHSSRFPVTFESTSNNQRHATFTLQRAQIAAAL